MSKPLVIVTSRFPAALVQDLERHATVIQGEDAAKGMKRDKVLEAVGHAFGIINQNELKIDEILLGRAPGLKIVANGSAGFDNMDIPAMRSRGVIGTNCPLSFAADTATHTIALLLAVTRRLIEADSYVRSGQWKHQGWMPGGRWDGVSLEGRTIGIVGHGQIGRKVAERAAAFGMIIRHHTRLRQDLPDWRPLDELLATSDVVSLHCPLNDSTRHLMDANAFARMKPGSILLNVSRGPVVSNDALLAALKSGHLLGAGLDVFEFEPDVPEALFALPNVVLSPHMGGCTVDARQHASRLCVDNVIAVLRGQPARTPVV